MTKDGLIIGEIENPCQWKFPTLLVPTPSITTGSTIASLGTKDFIAAMEAQNIKLMPYLPDTTMTGSTIAQPCQDRRIDNPIFGRRIRKTIEAWKRLWRG